MQISSYGRINIRAKHNVELTPLSGFLIGILLTGGVIAALYIHGNFSSGNVVKTTTAPSTGSLVSTTLVLGPSVTDAIGQSVVPDALIDFYTVSGTYQATCTTDSGGSCQTTGITFTSGTPLVAEITTAGYVTEFLPFTVPYIPSGSASLTAIPIAFYQLTLGHWKATVTVGGNVLTGGLDLAYTFPSTAAQPVTVSLQNTELGTGYLSCNPGTGLQYDLVNGICQNAVFQITDTGNLLSLTGMASAYSSGTTRYWWSLVPDGAGLTAASNAGPGVITQAKAPGAGPDTTQSSSNTGGSLTYQSIGQTIYGGVATITYQIKPGALVSGTEATDLSLWIYASPNYFPTNQNLGPNAVNASDVYQLTFTAP